jgi:Family of unknown function (DUF6011)
MSNKPVSFDDLDDGLTSRPATGGVSMDRVSVVNGGNADYQQIPCPKCGGRGFKVYGYVNIQSYPCRMCKETGKVTAKRIASVEAAKKGRITAENNKRDRYNGFREAHPEIIAFLSKNSEWSDFFRSLQDQLIDRGSLSENQVAAIQRSMGKMAAKAAEKAAEREKSAESVDLTKISELFSTARSSGLKRLAFRAVDIEISEASQTGKNPGALYVKRNGEYQGKIVSGKFFAVREANGATKSRVQAVAADPTGEAILYGKQTGTCACCGRELENALSVELGIGPICRGKWGL